VPNSPCSPSAARSGPALAGVILTTARSYTPILLLTIAGFLAAAATIATGVRPRPTNP
jgi:hypothetical protein